MASIFTSTDRARTTALAAALSLLVGCAPPVEQPVSNMCPFEDAPRCDVRAPSCQQAALDYLTCLREAPPATLPAIRVIDEAALATELGDQAPADAEVGLGRALTLLGLHDPAAGDYLEARQALEAGTIAGYYDAAQDQITLVDRGLPFDDPQMVSLLVHELTHAQQHAHHDLTALFAQHGQHLDARLALRALVEGDARFAEWLVRLAWHGQTIWRVVDPTRELVANLAAELSTSPTPALRGLAAFPYVWGFAWVNGWWTGWGGGSHAALQAAFAEPPGSTEAILAGRLSASLPRVFDVIPPDDASLLLDDTLGAWILRLYLTRAGGAPNAALEAHFVSDQLLVFEQAGATTALWISEWSSADSAAAFAAIAPGAAQSIDDVVLAVVSEAEDAVDGWRGRGVAAINRGGHRRWSPRKARRPFVCLTP